MHYRKRWFYWMSELENKKYWRKEYSEDIIYLPENIKTERECRQYLSQILGATQITKAYPYHSSQSNNGSRPIKNTVNRKKFLKEKLQFIHELSN